MNAQKYTQKSLEAVQNAQSIATEYGNQQIEQPHLLLALLLTQLWPVTAYAVEDIQLDAKAALLVDGATGTVLLDQDAHTKQYPASITKVMTALLVSEAIDRGELRLSDSITASANSVAGLPEERTE